MLKRNLCFFPLTCALAFPAVAHEFSFGAGALSANLLSQISFTDNSLSPPNDIQWSATGNTITGEFYVGYAYNINKGFDIGVEVFYVLDGPEVEQWVLIDRYVKHSVKNAIGARVVPGFNITPSTRVIAEVGYLYMEQEISVIDLDIASEFSSTSATAKNGTVVYGVGIETMIYEAFGFRASYNVAPRMGNTNSSSNSVSISTTSGSPDDFTYSASPVLQFFYLGGILRFGF